MPETKSIAILMATYHGEKYIREQIDSILRQTNTQWVLYIHDDGSKDHTLDIIHDYVQSYPEKIHLLDYPSQGGACNNFFSLLERVDADYYMFADQDDVWHDDKIEKTMSLMVQKERELSDRPVVIHTDLNVVDESLKQIHPSFWSYSAIFPEAVKDTQDCVVCIATGCTMLFNKQAKAAAFKWSHHYATMHDAWVLICCYAAGGEAVAYPQATIDYRQHGNNTLGAQDIHRLTLSYRWKHLVEMQKTNWGIYRMLNSVKPLSLLYFIYKRIQYKKTISINARK